MDLINFKLSILDTTQIQEHNFTPNSLTMIGYRNLSNIEDLFNIVVKNNIEGDFVETGVWKGGAAMYMAYLNKYHQLGRKIFACDSYEGLPKDSLFEEDKIVNGNDKKYDYAISLEEVQNNFTKYNLLDDNVCFIKGFFETSLKNAPIEKIAILRLDGDMYTSTISVLEELYDKVSIGGFIIIDDYRWEIAGCGNAINDFRKKRNITAPILSDGCYACCVYWIKEN